MAPAAALDFPAASIVAHLLADQIRQRAPDRRAVYESEEGSAAGIEIEEVERQLVRFVGDAGHRGKRGGDPLVVERGLLLQRLRVYDDEFDGPSRQLAIPKAIRFADPRS